MEADANGNKESRFFLASLVNEGNARHRPWPR